MKEATNELKKVYITHCTVHERFFATYPQDSGVSNFFREIITCNSFSNYSVHIVGKCAYCNPMPNTHTISRLELQSNDDSGTILCLLVDYEGCFNDCGEVVSLMPKFKAICGVNFFAGKINTQLLPNIMSAIGIPALYEHAQLLILENPELANQWIVDAFMNLFKETIQ